MDAEAPGAEPQPFIQKKASTQNGARYLRFECPHCGTVKERREDSLLLGMHMLVCGTCSYTTDRVKINGRVRKKTATDHKSPDDAQRPV